MTTTTPANKPSDPLWVEPPESFKRSFEWDRLNDDDRQWLAARYQKTMPGTWRRLGRAFRRLFAALGFEWITR